MWKRHLIWEHSFIVNNNVYYGLTTMGLILSVLALGQVETKKREEEAAVPGAELGSRLQPLTFPARKGSPPPSSPVFLSALSASFSSFPVRAAARVALLISVPGGR